MLLLPGSRAKEIDYILPHLLDAVRRLDADAATASSRSRSRTRWTAPTSRRASRAAGVPVPVIAGDTYNLIAASDVALVTSGTATLECALLECPMVIVYRLSPLTFALGRLLVRGVPHVGMPNIVAGREVVPELLQRDVTGAAHRRRGARHPRRSRARRRRSARGCARCGSASGAGARPIAPRRSRSR